MYKNDTVAIGYCSANVCDVLNIIILFITISYYLCFRSCGAWLNIVYCITQYFQFSNLL